MINLDSGRLSPASKKRQVLYTTSESRLTVPDGLAGISSELKAIA
jgi:hypothetical protein